MTAGKIESELNDIYNQYYNYSIVDILGQSPYSITYIVNVTDILKTKTKEILKRFTIEDKHKDIFVEELGKLFRNHHIIDNIPENIDYIIYDNIIYIRFKYIYGNNLSEIEISQNEFETMFYCILNTLYKLHNYNIKHRDIKKENIIKIDDQNDKQISNYMLVDLGIPNNYYSINPSYSEDNNWEKNDILQLCNIAKEYLTLNKQEENENKRSSLCEASSIIFNDTVNKLMLDEISLEDIISNKNE